MRKILKIALLLFFILESVHSQTVTNHGTTLNSSSEWRFQFDTRTIPSIGKSLDGVRLSIAMSNNVMIVGSTNLVHCRMDNMSTNGVELDGSMSMHPAAAFVISNSFGKMFLLQPDPAREISCIGTIHLSAGKSCEWDAPIEIGKDIGSGVYYITAKQSLYIPLNSTNNPGGAIVSNSLKVSVKRR